MPEPKRELHVPENAKSVRGENAYPVDWLRTAALKETAKETGKYQPEVRSRAQMVAYEMQKKAQGKPYDQGFIDRNKKYLYHNRGQSR